MNGALPGTTLNTATALISYDGLTCGNASPRERALASLRPADVQDLEPVQHKCRCRVKRQLTWPLASMLPIAAISLAGQVQSRSSSRVRAPRSLTGAVAL